MTNQEKVACPKCGKTIIRSKDMAAFPMRKFVNLAAKSRTRYMVNSIGEAMRVKVYQLHKCKD